MAHISRPKNHQMSQGIAHPGIPNRGNRPGHVIPIPGRLARNFLKNILFCMHNIKSKFCNLVSNFLPTWERFFNLQKCK